MKFVEYLGTVNIFVTNLVGSFAFLDMVDRDALLTNSARFVCPFSMRQNGIETNLCPVLYMTALCGRLVECDANDCFKANIVANIGDDENVFDLFQHMFDQSDMPSFYDALLEAYTKPNRTEIRTVPIKLKSSVLHQTGWLAFNPAKPTAQAKLFFNISEDGAFAAYSVCLFPCEDRIMNSQTPAQAKQPVAVAYETNFSAPDGDDKEPSES